MGSNALIFLPDISGFTQFVTQTEIQHSRHIVAELLETVMRANVLGFKISEVEEDVVLYHEYLLLTQKYLQTQPSGPRRPEEWVTFKTNIEELETFGEVHTEFIPFSSLRSQVPAAPPRGEYPLEVGAPDATITIDARLLLVHDVLTDNARKAEYARGSRTSGRRDPSTV